VAEDLERVKKLSGIPAVSVALQRGDTLLLVKRANEPAKDQWAFPGGRVERGEKLEAAARRELLEETGMEAGELGVHVELLLGKFLLTVFRGEALEGEPVAQDDALAAGFYDLREIETIDATESTKACARMILGKKSNSLGSALADLGFAAE
jgi:8-oxo-dGTP diphosphatase